MKEKWWIYLFFYPGSLAIFWWISRKLERQIGRVDISVCYVCDLASPFLRERIKGVVPGGDIFLQKKTEGREKKHNK